MMYLSEELSHLVRGAHVRTQFIATTIVLAAVAAATALLPPSAGAQARTSASVCPDSTPTVFHACALEAANTFDPPRTSDGQPDLGGIWNRLGGAFEDLEEHPEALDDNGNPTAIVDPPDGRVPMQAWADARRQENNEAYIHPSAACFLSGMPYTMYRPGSFQFLQTPGYFIVLGARAHTYRIIHMDERPPLGEKIRLWNGDSRGHWEGNTLVIETTNQNAKPWLDQRARFYTEEAQVVERLTLIGPDTIHYQATVDDPNVYTDAFTIALDYRRNTGQGSELLVEACYENNEALLEIYRTLGLTIYPGISAEEAREAAETEP